MNTALCAHIYPLNANSKVNLVIINGTMNKAKDITIRREGKGREGKGAV
jgi:hypothetical protein